MLMYVGFGFADRFLYNSWSKACLYELVQLRMDNFKTNPNTSLAQRPNLISKWIEMYKSLYLLYTFL
jgi:hypothetical protein